MRLKFTRRKFILSACAAVPGALLGYSRFIESGWVKVRTVKLTSGKPSHRFVHFTDLHYKGDRDAMLELVELINGLSPEFVCFTGDLIEEGLHLDEAIELLSLIKAPVYGVPGNHDFWSNVPMQRFADGFAAMGGAWLMDEQVMLAGGKINLIGASCRSQEQPELPIRDGAFNLLLVHYPAWVKALTQKFDLILAGHSHGGQVRIPFYGPVALPFLVDEYDLGMFQTAAGPLYVNPGIGWFPVALRFNCRPEVTVFEV